MKERNDGSESPSESEDEARPKIRRSW